MNRGASGAFSSMLTFFLTLTFIIFCSRAPVHCKVILILFPSFLVSVLCFFIDGSLFKVIAIPTIAIAKRLSLLFANFKSVKLRAKTIATITIWKAIQIMSHEPIYKTKNLSKEIKSNTFCYRKVGRAITLWGAIEKSRILLSQYWKNDNF